MRMRPIFAPIIGLLLAANAWAQNTKSDREFDELMGPVKEVRSEVARIDMKNDQPTEKEKKFAERRSYDERGNLLERTYRSPNDGMINRVVYQHDPKGNYVEILYPGFR